MLPTWRDPSATLTRPCCACVWTNLNTVLNAGLPRSTDVASAVRIVLSPIEVFERLHHCQLKLFMNKDRRPVGFRVDHMAMESVVIRDGASDGKRTHREAEERPHQAQIITFHYDSAGEDDGEDDGLGVQLQGISNRKFMFPFSCIFGLFKLLDDLRIDHAELPDGVVVDSGDAIVGTLNLHNAAASSFCHGVQQVAEVRYNGTDLGYGENSEVSVALTGKEGTYLSQPQSYKATSGRKRA